MTFNDGSVQQGFFGSAYFFDFPNFMINSETYLFRDFAEIYSKECWYIPHSHQLISAACPGYIKVQYKINEKRFVPKIFHISI